MKIILVGASGTIGQAVHADLSQRHEVIRVGRTSGDVHADIGDSDSIKRLYLQVGEFDALISTAGDVHYGPLDELTPEQFDIGLRSKLMGQVNLVTLGLALVRAGGSFTLTSGQLNDDPIRQGASSSLVNGGLEGFVRGAAIELPRGVRINVVSPALVEESLPTFGKFFPGTKAIPAREAALGYVKSVEGAQTGRVYRIGWTRDD
ncbi:MAG: short chain dehydrogenase [Pelagibacterium sp. SCN 64-44]|nr:MAG: short chain dehydrogenase [Pelagibacterium sp. SCN 64-44]